MTKAQVALTFCTRCEHYHRSTQTCEEARAEQIERIYETYRVFEAWRREHSGY